MEPLYTAEQVRQAEKPLLDAQSEPDALMRTAAAAVARTARKMVPGESARLILLVGSGGNGGDALYAGADILRSRPGWAVDAILCSDSIHERALDAFRDAGGREIDPDQLSEFDYALAVDGIVGIGGTGGLRALPAAVVAELSDMGVPFLAVDIPSGVAADTGFVSEPHVTADTTVTFGGLRRAHALSPAVCGEVVLVDIGLDGQPRLSEILGGSDVTYIRALHNPVDVPPLEPAPDDDKYTGGVVSVCAGSGTYPGAGILATTAAVRASSAMVRYIGSCRDEVVRALPEVVVHDTVENSGRCQAWVIGPGRGTDSAAAEELRHVLSEEEPVLVDADGLTLLATHPDLAETVRTRAANSRVTALTPHKGEFRRLADSLGLTVTGDIIADTSTMAANLGAIVLLKGRTTVIAEPPSEPPADSSARVTVVDSGSSWAATPGSGDVLSGLAGAWVARNAGRETSGSGAFEALVLSTVIHATAAHLSARTEFGPAPTSASLIAESIRPATAAVAK